VLLALFFLILSYFVSLATVFYVIYIREGKKSKTIIQQSEHKIMNMDQQARALLQRHHQLIKNRQQSMLERAAEEIGVDVDSNYRGTIQGQTQSDFSKSYDRSNASLS
jgi:hypothetical protein